MLKVITLATIAGLCCLFEAVRGVITPFPTHTSGYKSAGTGTLKFSYCDTSKNTNSIYFFESDGTIKNAMETSIFASPLTKLPNLSGSDKVTALWCGRKAFAVRFGNDTTAAAFSNSRIYIHDVDKTFSTQNFIADSADFFGVQAFDQRNGIVAIFTSSATSVKIMFNPYQSNVIDTNKNTFLTFNHNLGALKDFALLPNTYTIILAFTNTLVLFKVDPATNAITLVTQNNGVFFQSIRQVAAVAPKQLSTTGDDDYYVVQDAIISGNAVTDITLWKQSGTAMLTSSDYNFAKRKTYTSSGTEIKVLYTTLDRFVVAQDPNAKMFYLLTKDLEQINSKTYDPTSYTGTGKMAVATIDSKIYAGLGYSTSASDAQTSTYMFEPWTFTDCYAGCKTCLSGDKCYDECQTGFYSHSPTTPEWRYCYADKASVPDALGVNALTGMLVACVELQCKRCVEDYEVCTFCKQETPFVAANTRYLITDVSYTYKPICKIGIPDRFGVILTNGAVANGNYAVEQCTITDCEVCSTSSTGCDRCSSGRYSHTQSLVTTCILPANIPQGFGINTLGYNTVACNVADCKNCQSNYDKFCTECTTAGSYVLPVTPNVCIDPTVATTTTSYGIKGSDKILAACEDTGCNKCLLDYQDCTECKAVDTSSNALYRGKIPSTIKHVCRSASKIPEGTYTHIDGGTSEKLFDDCTLTNCAACPADVCNKCKSTYWLHQHNLNTASDNTCMMKAEVLALLSTNPDRAYGVNGDNFEPCSANCNLCIENKNICTECASTYSLYAQDTSVVCIQASGIPVGYGLNIANNQIVKCQEQYCIDCKDDYTKCIACNPLTYSYVKVNGTLPIPDYLGCVNYDNIPDTWGKDRTKANSMVLRKCFSATGCLICPSDFYKCDQCTNGLYILPDLAASTESCIDLANTDPVGFGKYSTSQRLLACTDTNCKFCEADKAVCTECKSSWYLDDTLKKVNGLVTCQNQASITSDNRFAKTGLDLINNKIKGCYDSNCDQCFADYTACSKCASTYFIRKDLPSKQCDLKAAFDATSGVGIVLAQNAVAPTVDVCSDNNCDECTEDTTKCLGCKAGFYALYDVGTCHATGSFPAHTGIVNGATFLTIRACAETNCDTCSLNFEVCTACKSTFVLIEYPDTRKPTCLSQASAMPEGFGLDITSSGTKAKQCTSITSAWNCKLCPTNYLRCEECTSLYRLDTTLTTDVSGICKAKSGTYANLGVDTADARLLKACTVKDCDECFTNYVDCSKCKATFLLDKESIPSHTFCRAATFKIDGFGLNAGNLVQCESAGCLLCNAAYNDCKNCSSDYALDVNANTRGYCLLKTNMPASKGYDTNADPVTYVRSCNQPKCTKCSVYTNCLECSTGAYLTGSTCTDCPAGCSACTSANWCTSCSTGKLDRVSEVGKSKCISTPLDLTGNDPLDSQIISLCKDANCQKCAANNLKCTQCKASFTLVQELNVDTTFYGTCKPAGSVPIIFGLGDTTSPALTGVLRSCNDANCADCHTNAIDCITCRVDTPIPYYLYKDSVTSATSCVKKDLITTAHPSFGIKAGTNQLQACSVANCVDCATDYTQCKVCANTYGLALKADGSTTCESTPPEGFGHVPSSTRIEPCVVKNCKTCTANNQICTACYPILDTWGYLNTTTAGTQVCLTSITAGYGVNFANNKQLDLCKDSLYCTSCTLDSQKCQTCSSSVYYIKIANTDAPADALATTKAKYSSATFVRCVYPIEGIPPGFGKDPDNVNSKELKACVGSCLDCGDNYKICTTCPLNYLQLPDKSCVSSAQLSTLELYGKQRDPSSGMVTSNSLVTCTDTNCLKCSDWSMVCTACKPNWYLYTSPLGGSHNNCSQATHLVGSGLGLSLNDATVKPCSDTTTCQDCSSDNTKCLACNPAFYYKPVTSGSPVTCRTMAQLQQSGDRLGPKTNTKQLEECNSECATCFTDSLVCDKCSNVAKYLVSATAINNCQLFASIVETAGKGANPSTKQIVDCISTGCKHCWSDFRKCTECKSGFNGDADLYGTSGYCVATASIPEGKGVNMASTSTPKTLTKCSLSTCADCAADSTKCQACKTDLFAEMNTGTGLVVACHASSLATVMTPLGKQSGGSKILKACSSTGCSNCKELFSTCVVCSPEYYLYNSECKAETEVPPAGLGKDKDSAVRGYKSCTDGGCAKCPDNYKVCTECSGSLIVSEGICVVEDTTHIGKGVNTGTGITVSCSDTGCKDCLADYSKCVECFPGMSLLSTNGAKVCTLINAIPYGQGVSGKEVTTCKVAGCQVCSVDASKCEYCSNTKYLYKDSTGDQCLAVSDIPKGYGVKGLTAVACKDTNCGTCQADYSVCETCKDSYYIDPTQSDKVCVNSEIKISKEKVKEAFKNENIQKVNKNMNDGKVTMTFNVDISSASMDKLQFLAFRDDGTIIKDFKVTVFKVFSDLVTAYLEFTTSGIVNDINILIKNKVSSTSSGTSAFIKAGVSRRRLQAQYSDTDPFEKGVYIEGAGFYNGQSVSIFKGGSLVLTIIMMVAAFANIFKEDSWTYRVIEVSIMIGMFKVWYTQAGLYFASLIYWFDINLLSAIPFFKFNDDKTECAPEGYLFFTGYSCFVYNNLRRYVPTLVAWAVVVYAVKLLVDRTRKITRASDGKVPNVINERIQVPFSLSKNVIDTLFTVMLPFVYFSFINIYYVNGASLMKYGFVISTILIAMYVFLLGAATKYVVSYQPEDETKRELTPMEQSLLTDISIESDTKYKKYARLAHLYRNFLLGLLLAVLNEKSRAQTIVAMVLLLITFVVYVLFRPFNQRFKNTYAIAMEGLYFLISVCLLISSEGSSSISPTVKQDYLNWITVLLLLGIILSTVIFVLSNICPADSKPKKTQTRLEGGRGPTEESRMVGQ